MKKFLAILAAASLLVPFFGIDRRAEANTKPQLLTGILNKMEKAHQEMKSLKAELILQKTNTQIGITDTEYGDLIYKPAVGKTKGKLRIDYFKPSKNIVAVIGENVTFYQPRINQAIKSTIAKATKGKVNGYAQLVGLDGSLKALVGNYNIDILKDEAVNGQLTTVLRLIPKSGGQFTTIDIWVNQNGLPTQWKMIERNGDYTVATLKNAQVNANIADAAFNVSIPNGVAILDKF